jgi:hypothetical protein
MVDSLFRMACVESLLLWCRLRAAAAEAGADAIECPCRWEGGVDVRYHSIWIRDDHGQVRPLIQIG